jgi:hypothetical protein
MTGYFQRLALNVAEPSRSIQPVLDPLFAPSNPTGDLDAIETGEQFTAAVPTKSNPPDRSQPSPDLPDARALPARKPSPKTGRPAQSTESFFPVSTASVPRPQKKPEPLIVRRLAQKSGHQTTAEPTKPRHETTMRRQVEEGQVNDTPPRDSAASVRSSTFVPPPLLAPTKETAGPVVIPELPGNRGDQKQEDTLKPRSLTIVRPPPEQGIERPLDETKPGAIAASEEFRQPAALRPTLSLGAERKENIRSQNRLAAKQEPDEIHIHIGRIEVVAVPPATVAPGSPKPKRETPSLDEYLQRRPGRSV